jgi:cytochrome c biogenesis protein CcdA
MSERMRKNILSLFFALFLIGNTMAYANEKSSDLPVLMVFYSPTCHSCIKVKSEIMPMIEKVSAGKYLIEYRDIEEIENFKLLVSLKEKHNVTLSNDMPVFYFNGNFLNGETEIERTWRDFLARSLLATGGVGKQDLPQVDLVSRFKEFKLLAVSGAGLIDGINPCAFTVLVFFISFLALQGYMKKELIAIGASFIFAVFVAYLLIGVGAFSFLYKMQGFKAVIKMTNMAIGSLTILFGMLALYDFFKYKTTGKTDGLVLQLPKAVKEQIHRVIRTHHRVDKQEQGVAKKRHLWPLILSALTTGFSVSILEAVCTGQTYLPIIAFILKTTDLKLQAFFYLVLYNFMFVVPLIVIFIFALFGATSAHFSGFLKRHLGLIKIFMAILFFSLGIFLIIKA